MWRDSAAEKGLSAPSRVERDLSGRECDQVPRTKRRAGAERGYARWADNGRTYGPSAAAHQLVPILAR
jgi:hypothetical protein